MIKKLKALSQTVKDINCDLDELFKVMDGGKITINFDDSPMENEEVKEMSILIDNVKDDFGLIRNETEVNNTEPDYEDPWYWTYDYRIDKKDKNKKVMSNRKKKSRKNRRLKES